MKEKYNVGVILKKGDVNWLPRLFGLTPLGYFDWERVKIKVYKRIYSLLLVKMIKLFVELVSCNNHNSENLRKRLNICLIARGGNLLHTVFVWKIRSWWPCCMIFMETKMLVWVSSWSLSRVILSKNILGAGMWLIGSSEVKVSEYLTKLFKKMWFEWHFIVKYIEWIDKKNANRSWSKEKALILIQIYITSTKSCKIL